MLKRFLISAACLLLLLSASALAGTKASENQKPKLAATATKGIPASTYSGKMQLSEDFFDFGYLPRSSKVSHIFWLKNVGNDSLEIISIKPG